MLQVLLFFPFQLILLENVESQRGVVEKRLETTSAKLRDTEKALENTKKEILNMQDMLEESQGQYIALEKKYYKAKKLIKEYQQRCVGFTNFLCIWKCMSIVLRLFAMWLL